MSLTPPSTPGSSGKFPSGRIQSIEYMRAFSMLYIVGFWHLLDYTDDPFGIREHLSSKPALVLLGLFVIISGYLIGRPSSRGGSPMQIYRKRLVRIYPLYALAVILYFLFGISDASTSIKSLFIVSIFYGPSPYTLWFMTVIILFYLMSPILLKLVETPQKYLLVTAALSLLILCLEAVIHSMDRRILYYFPCFCVGIYCARYGLKQKLVNSYTALLLFCIWLVILFVDDDSWTLRQFEYLSMILSCSFLVFAAFRFNESVFRRSGVVSFLSYSSFAMYLFHRPIFSAMVGLYFPEGPVLQMVYLMTIGLLVVIVISWVLQKTYDIAVAKVFNAA